MPSGWPSFRILGSSRSPTVTICASRRFEYSTRTCFWSWADAVSSGIAVVTAASSQPQTATLRFLGIVRQK